MIAEQTLPGRPRNSMHWLGRALVYAGLVLATVLFIAPFLWLISNSLKDAAHAFDANWIPQPQIEWANYVHIFARCLSC